MLCGTLQNAFRLFRLGKLDGSQLARIAAGDQLASPSGVDRGSGFGNPPPAPGRSISVA
jgi:hypothetical protein